MIIGDIETDGLLPECTKIHCASFYDIDKDKWEIFEPKDIRLLPQYLNQVKSLSMHNGIGFDLKVFKKLLNINYRGYYIDTLIMSQILWPDIEKPSYKNDKDQLITVKGIHSVEAWGVRLGISKPVHEDWSTYTKEMLHRNIEDVKIQTALYKKCISTIEDFKRKDPRLNNWGQIFKLEQGFWQGMEIQAENGWLLDIDKCYEYIQQLKKDMSQIDDQLEDILPFVVKPGTECQAFKKNGDITNHALNWINGSLSKKEDLCGNFSRVKFEKLNLNSPEQLKDFLLKEGWTPREYNFKKDKHNKAIKDDKGNLTYTGPKLPKELEDWELAAEETDSPAIKLLANRGKIKHRLGLLQGLYDSVRPDRRVEARMISCGTPTARARHMGVVNIPKAEEGVFFGKECRSIFIVPEGKVLVGVDASALEARCEAHYLYKIDRNAADFILNGDIHSFNAQVWDVVRSIAKNGKYALTYGCSAQKLAITLKKPSEMSKQLYNDFWDANPALKELVRLLKEQREAKGYLVAIDGRPLSVRYAHTSLNTLLQSAGSIVMKKAWCLFNEWRISEGLQKEILDVGNFHDETQMEVIPSLAEEVGQKYIDCIALAGEMLKFNIPLTGDYRVGSNWSETH